MSQYWNRCWTVVLCLVVAAGCASIPKAPDLGDEFAYPPADLGALSELSDRLGARMKPSESAFHLIADNRDALMDRLALVDMATSSIDLQYFIWQDDPSGQLLFDRVLQAADRGVRVRLLVDDMGITARRRDLAAYSSHSNFEIRIYNPFSSFTSFLFRFKELNRRMHNKIMIVDNRVAIAGGRNIGDPYFGLSEKYNFRDLDVLTVGAVVEEISKAYDTYWNNDIAYPALAFSKNTADTPEERAELVAVRRELREELEAQAALLVSYPREWREWGDWIDELEEGLEIGEGHFLQDEPVDVDGKAMRLVDMLDYMSSPLEEEYLLVSPYLIPVGDQLATLSATVDSGVDVRILTGSMGSNNHTAAHSHYKKYRKRLLDTGAQLFEARHDLGAEMRRFSDVEPVTAEFISLHIKALIGDRKNSFIGSLNLDPRAMNINTENGLYIESAAIAEQLVAMLEEMMAPENAWHVGRDDEGNLFWTSAEGTVTRQPARSGGQRVADFFFRLLPIESQL